MCSEDHYDRWQSLVVRAAAGKPAETLMDRSRCLKAVGIAFIVEFWSQLVADIIMIL